MHRRADHDRVVAGLDLLRHVADDHCEAVAQHGNAVLVQPGELGELLLHRPLANEAAGDLLLFGRQDVHAEATCVPHRTERPRRVVEADEQQRRVERKRRKGIERGTVRAFRTPRRDDADAGRPEAHEAAVVGLIDHSAEPTNRRPQVIHQRHDRSGGLERRHELRREQPHRRARSLVRHVAELEECRQRSAAERALRLEQLLPRRLGGAGDGDAEVDELLVRVVAERLQSPLGSSGTGRPVCGKPAASLARAKRAREAVTHLACPLVRPDPCTLQ